MKFRWKNLLLWFAGAYLFISPIQRTLLYGKPLKIWKWDDPKMVWLTLSGFLVFFIYTLGIYTVFYLFYSNKKWSKIALFSILVLVLPIFIRYGIEEILYDKMLGFSNYSDSMSFKSYFVDNLFYSFRFGLLGLIYFFIQNTFYRQKRQAQLEIENKQVQLESLRSQLNPHFLLNSLNNIYSLVYHKSDKALPALENLSELLKYGLYEEQQKVTLEKELDFVKEYIALHQYRVANPLNLKLSVSDEALQAKIPHFLLIPLLENVFNHGNVKEEIVLDTKLVSNQLEITLENTIAPNRMKENGGIGLQNTQKRLQLLYGSQAEIKTERINGKFIVTIQLPHS